MTFLKQDWLARFDGLADLPEDLREELVKGSRLVHYAAGEQIFQPGDSGDNLLMLVQGTVRVQQKSETGREVSLYRVHAGDSCVMTTACMLAYEDYSADGVAETDVEALAISRVTFDSLVARSPLFRQMVFRAFSRRITDLLTLIDDIVFQRLDVRLAARLLELAGTDDTVHATHQVLANELGTAREVISRTLADFQRRGWVEQSRGAVKITGRAGLERMARSAG
ncbi:Crp/Fnr family transcriptional regulator [Pseudooceanicola sp. CBS1P-1]|uniref:Cyclic nucleotide-binding domain-containing protein n=1 Tax=Pseudooceanicola albus TaxID=2692189 RepID=A0A6L7G3K4_9RHOB|nr:MULTISPECIES: Crp/Fnr family transcriptional regulator [Pseudooceanicola]MBT9384980.1 Crp/Fnr family transcriptional regulator [Pseudooceanicola endophyticus]MXN18026.1 cyclic nucleotide-binding domain-containing protein [Pseudooceanicola albus]